MQYHPIQQKFQYCSLRPHFSRVCNDRQLIADGHFAVHSHPSPSTRHCPDRGLLAIIVHLRAAIPCAVSETDSHLRN